MEDADGVWFELRVDGEVSVRYGQSELDAAVAAADAHVQQAPAAVVEVVRCRPNGGRTTVLRYAPPDAVASS